jgi:hypothetical protein
MVTRIAGLVLHNEQRPSVGHTELNIVTRFLIDWIKAGLSEIAMT